jgi:hypothetical protein
MLLSAFSLVGVTLFSGILQYECYDDVHVDNATALIGSSVQYKCPRPIQNSMDCTSNMCSQLSVPRMFGDDDSGYLGFDNFILGFISMVVLMSGDGGMSNLPQAIHEAGLSRQALAAWWLSAGATIVLQFVALNLLLALCCSALTNATSNIAKRTADQDALSKRMKHASRGKSFGVASVHDFLESGLGDFAEQRDNVNKAKKKVQWKGGARSKIKSLSEKDASWPRSWANFSLLCLYSRRNAWANLRLLGQPNTFLSRL